MLNFGTWILTRGLFMLFRVLIFMLTAGLANAEMSSIDDSDLSEVTGQSGVYLTGEVSI
ncbi:DUF6160 family protein, partial [Oleiphilus sp. HI0061]|uniref:DUF6160 family protein n=1 Tax=Oleiphilus sp. HI0061 TaxID=1822239 RepID=UPI003517C288